MSTDVATDEPPGWQEAEADWLSGDVANVQRNVENPKLWKASVVKKGTGGPLKVVLSGPPDDTVLALTGSGSVVIEGTCSAGVRVEFDAQFSALAVHAPLSNVSGGHNQLKLTLPTTDITVEASGSALTLKPPTGDDAQPGHVTAQMTKSSGPSTLGGTVPVQAATFATSGLATLNAPLAEGGTVEASGQLHFASTPSDGITVRADELRMVNCATPGLYDCRLATFEGGTAGGDEQPVLIEQRAPDSDRAGEPGALIVGLNLDRSQVAWRGLVDVQQSITRCDDVSTDGKVQVGQHVTDSAISANEANVKGNLATATVNTNEGCELGGDVAAATVKAGGPVHIVGNVSDGSDLTSRSTETFAITVGSTAQKHPVPERSDYDRARFDERSALKSPVGNYAVPNGKGSIGGSKVTVTGNDAGVSCRSASATTFNVPGLLRVQQHIDVTKPAVAGRLRAKTVAISQDNEKHFAQVGWLVVDDLTVDGHIRALANVTCNRLRPPTGDDDNPLDVPIRIDAGHIEIVEGVEGRPHLKAAEELAIKSSGGESLTIESTGGNVTTYGYTIERACLNGDDIYARFRSPVIVLDVTGSPVINLAETASVSTAHVSGHLTLQIPESGRHDIDTQERPPSIEIADKGAKDGGSRITAGLSAGASLAVHALNDDGQAEEGVSLSIQRTDGGKADEPLALNLSAGGRVASKTFNMDAASDLPPTEAPCLTIETPLNLSVSGIIGSLTASGGNGNSWLTVRADAPGDSIYDASGHVALGPFAGALHSAEGQDLVLRKVEDQAGEGRQRTSGKIIDVDITRLAVDDLERLEPLEIIEPTAQSLRALGVPEPSTGPAEDRRRDIRALAERARRINQLIEYRAVSGSSRAAAKWAEARLHHESIPRGKWEYRIRRVPRALGYGQRPEFPLATLAAVYAVVVLGRLTCWASPSVNGYCAGQPIQDEGWFSTVLAALSQTLQQPFTLVQFGRDASALFGNDLMNLMTSALLGIPFLFFIISFKNYLSLKGT